MNIIRRTLIKLIVPKPDTQKLWVVMKFEGKEPGHEIVPADQPWQSPKVIEIPAAPPVPMLHGVFDTEELAILNCWTDEYQKTNTEWAIAQVELGTRTCLKATHYTNEELDNIRRKILYSCRHCGQRIFYSGPGYIGVHSCSDEVRCMHYDLPEHLSDQKFLGECRPEYGEYRLEEHERFVQRRYAYMSIPPFHPSRNRPKKGDRI